VEAFGKLRPPKACSCPIYGRQKNSCLTPSAYVRSSVWKRQLVVLPDRGSLWFAGHRRTGRWPPLADRRVIPVGRAVRRRRHRRTSAALSRNCDGHANAAPVDEDKVVPAICSSGSLGAAHINAAMLRRTDRMAESARAVAICRSATADERRKRSGGPATRWGRQRHCHRRRFRWRRIHSRFCDASDECSDCGGGLFDFDGRHLHPLRHGCVGVAPRRIYGYLWRPFVLATYGECLFARIPDGAEFAIRHGFQ
jgi:hypothetical protein